MRKLTFERRKYGKELLMDATHTSGLNIVSNTIVQSFYTIILAKKASGNYYLDLEHIQLDANMILFVKPGQINYVPQAHFQDGYFLFFEGDFLDEFFEDKHFIYKFTYFHQPDLPPYLMLPPDTFEKYHQVAAEICEEIKQLSNDSHHILRSLIYYLLVRLNQLYGNAYQTSGHTLIEPNLLQFLQLLEHQVSNLNSVQSFAEQLQISRVYLNQLCKKHFSKTAKQVIQERLVSELKKAIKYSGKDLSEIAFDYGFSAPSHFTRFFKRMTELSPQDFRSGLSNW